MPLQHSRPVACQAAVSPEKALEHKKAWERAMQMVKSGEVFETTVKSVNKGGIVVDCWTVNGTLQYGCSYA